MKYLSNQLLLILSLLVLPNNVLCKKEPYVYKGKEAEEKQFPFIAYVRNDIQGNTAMCTATLITEKKLLSAAHCFKIDEILPAPENVTVYAGTIDVSVITPDQPGIQERFCEDIAIPDKYDFTKKFHDVAVITVKEPFIMTEYVQLAEFSTKKMSNHTNCTIIGWDTGGEGFSGQLRYATGIKVQHITQGCMTFTKGDYLCIFDETSTLCDDDSGGPVICNGTVRGVASFSYSTPKALLKNNSMSCGKSDVDIYTDLSALAAFLNSSLSSVGSVQTPSGLVISVNSALQMLNCLLVSFQLWFWQSK